MSSFRLCQVEAIDVPSISTIVTITMMHRLAADAWIAFSARMIGESSEAYSIELMLLEEIGLVDPIHRPVNRGFNAIIEASVHTTRYLRNHDPMLGWLIRHHLVLARKNARGGRRG